MQAVIESAIYDAGVDSDMINYLETHGTGTALGDPMEVPCRVRPGSLSCKCYCDEGR